MKNTLFWLCLLFFSSTLEAQVHSTEKHYLKDTIDFFYSRATLDSILRRANVAHSLKLGINLKSADDLNNFGVRMLGQMKLASALTFFIVPHDISKHLGDPYLLAKNLHNTVNSEPRFSSLLLNPTAIDKQSPLGRARIVQGRGRGLAIFGLVHFGLARYHTCRYGSYKKGNHV